MTGFYFWTWPIDEVEIMISNVQSLFIKVSPNIKKLPAVVIKELLRELTQSLPIC